MWLYFCVKTSTYLDQQAEHQRGPDLTLVWGPLVKKFWFGWVVWINHRLVYATFAEQDHFIILFSPRPCYSCYSVGETGERVFKFHSFYIYHQFLSKVTAFNKPCHFFLSSSWGWWSHAQAIRLSGSQQHRCAGHTCKCFGFWKVLKLKSSPWIVASGSKNRVLEAKSLTDLKLIFLDVEPLSKLALYEHTRAQIYTCCVVVTLVLHVHSKFELNSLRLYCPLG